MSLFTGGEELTDYWRRTLLADGLCVLNVETAAETDFNTSLLQTGFNSLVEKLTKQ